MLDLNLSCAWVFRVLVYKLEKVVGSNNFSAYFIKIVFHNNIIVVGCMLGGLLGSSWQLCFPL